MVKTWRKENPCTLWVTIYISTAIMENDMNDPQKIKNELSYIQQSSKYVIKRKKSACLRDICTPMFITALFTRYGIHVWYSTQWNTLATSRKKEILSFMITRMNLEDIILSEVRQTQKDKYCQSHTCGI